MKTINDFLDFFSFDRNGKYPEEIRGKIALVNFLSLFSLFFVLEFGLLTLLSDEKFLFPTFILLGLFVFFMLNFLLFRKTGNHLLFFYFYLFLSYIAFLVPLLFHLMGAGVMAWFIIYPPLILYLLGLKRGTWVTIIFFATLASLFFIPGISTELYTNVPFTFKVYYLTAFVFLYIISLLYIGYLNRSLEMLKKTNEFIIGENEKRDKFLTTLSHQIRTPLNDIVAFESILKKISIPKEDRELFEMILASTNNLIQVVESITESGSFSVSDKKVSEYPFELSGILDNMKEISESQYKGRMNIRFNLENIKPGKVIGDRILIKQVFLNIFECILRNTPTPNINEIEVKALVDESGDEPALNVRFFCKEAIFSETPFRKLISLSDQGVRVITNPEDFQYINLLLARNLCRLVHGDLTLHDNVNSAPHILVTIPFKRMEEMPGISVVTGAAEIPVELKKDLNDAVVLLAEDNPINQKIVKISLSKYVKQIDVAPDGKVALDLYGKTKYDFILMDIQMPVMDGLVVTRKIREIESSTHTHTPIIAITANAMLGDKQTCLSAGVDDYISKPFQIETLVNKMKDLL